MKSKLSEAPVLISPDYGRQFIVQCDSSKFGVGAVLAQKNDEGLELPVAFFSKKLNKAQSNYSVTELECLSVMLALKKFRPYVEGQDFVVVTDHSSLQWLMRQTDLSGRLARWSLKLQGYRMKIEHRRGCQNVVPDSLSRQNFNPIEELENRPIINLDSSEFDSEQYTRLRDNIITNQSKLPDLRVVENKIYKRCDFANGDSENEIFIWKLWVPASLVNTVIDNAHSPPINVTEK